MEWNVGKDIMWATLKGGIDEGDVYTATIELDNITVDEDNIPCAAWLWDIRYRTRIDGRVNTIEIISGAAETIHGACNALLTGALAKRVITLQEYEEITGLRSAS